MKTILIVIIGAILIYLTLRFPISGFRSKHASPIFGVEENEELAKALERHVYTLSNEIGDRSVYQYDNLNKAADYIAGQFKSYGINAEFQEYLAADKKVKNIIATKVGDKNPDKILIVGAHYDTCFNPGADDNASAVAGVLELARLLANTKTDHTIRFVAFVNEEPPFFKTKKMGSRVYAESIKEEKENIIGAIIFEMIGFYRSEPNSQKYPWFLAPFYPNKGNFIAVVGNFNSRHLVKKTVRAFKGQIKFPIESTSLGSIVPGGDFSDHWSFWRERIPAIMVTDTSFYRNPYYHSGADTYEKLDYQSMAEVIRGFIVVLQLQGSGPDSPNHNKEKYYGS